MNLAISILIVIIVTLLLGWLTVRAGRSARPLVKWPSMIVAGLFTVAGVLVACLALLGLYRFYIPASAPAPAVGIEGSAAQVAQGERLAYLCAGCHTSGEDLLPLDGGVENFSPELGSLYAPNLTPGGPLQDWTDGEIIRAIREGVHKSGRGLLIMPSEDFHTMGDAEVQALVAYLRTQPAVARQTPETHLNLLGILLVGAGIFPLSVQPSISGPVDAPPAGPTAEYGEYLISLSGCGRCHGEDLRGGTSPFTPMGPNLRALLSQWSAAEFVETMRTGVDPYGHSLNPAEMPWPNYAAAFEDEELEAMYIYIRDLPPVAAP